jgi:16S rRNA (uracil1498-N3)-methyltransferase
MTAPHFFAEDVAGERIVLTGEEARHAVRVLRIRPGEAITISDGRGSVVEGLVVTAVGEEVTAEVKDRRTVEPALPALHIFHAIPKAGKLDLVVQKLTEIGADVIRPFPAARSVARWDDRKAAEQTRRLLSISREAAKQSRRAWLPAVLPPAALEAIDLPVPTYVLHEEATTRLSETLPDQAPGAIGLVVGPEGGLTPEEVAALTERGAQPVSLGPLILRTETAALAASVVLLSRYARIG